LADSAIIVTIRPQESREESVPTIRVMATGAVEPMVRLLGAEYEKQSGDTLALSFGTAGAVRARYESGEPVDLVVLPAAMIAAFDKAGLFVPGSVVDLGRTVTGVAVKQGAPAPDISTPEAFKRALLAARGIAFSDPAAGGSSGNYFARLIEKLGIATEVNSKAVLGKRGYEVAQAVVDGRAELGTTFISELMTVPGVTIIGPLPGELNFTNTYTAAIPLKSRERAAAQVLLGALTAPASRARWTEAGLEPAFPDLRGERVLPT
jgi:molybdate transport system substrate-binding protein